MKLNVRRLDPAARLPARAHEDDAGYDLCSVETHVIAPGDRARVRTGLAIELPRGHAGWVVPRSGLADRHGISLVNAPGLIDPGYRGAGLLPRLHRGRGADRDRARRGRLRVDRRLGTSPLRA